MSKYPEHEKLKTVQAESQAIGEFLDNLNTIGYSLGEWVKGYYETDHFVPARANIQDVLAKHFGINQKKLEREKNQMLKEVRRTA